MKLAEVFMSLIGHGHRAAIIDQAIERRERERRPALEQNARLRERIAAKMGIDVDQPEDRHG